jgi:N-acetylglutamate synthase-like GNAT family acetyltransferase
MLKFDCREIVFGPPEGFTKAQHDDFDALMSRIWPVAAGAVPHELTPQEERPDRMIAAVWDGERVIAHSESFRRTVFTVAGAMDILALTGVCVHPDYRGLGYGEAVAKAQLARVDRGEFPLAFYQTKVADFYRKLGAKTVENRVRNSRHPIDTEKPPFWEPYRIVYPATAIWPEGVVDLNGLGY